MASPPDLGFLQEGLNTVEPSPFSVRDFVLPPDMKEFAELTQVEVVDLLDVSVVDNPGLTGVEQGGQCIVINTSSLTYSTEWRKENADLVKQKVLMSKEDNYVGKESLVFDEKIQKYLWCGEELPQSWRSAGFEPIKKKIHETNAMIFVCKNGGTAKEFRKKYQMMKRQRKSESKGAVNFPALESAKEGTSGRKMTPSKPEGKKMTFAEAVRAVIMHRRCSKIKAVAYLSQLPKEKKDRKLNDLQCFLDSLVNVLQVLCNLRDRDLRTKVALSRLALKQLRQESGHITEPTASLQSRKSTLVFEGKESYEDDAESVKSWDDLVSFKSRGHFEDSSYQASRKLPPWQMIALESTDSNKNWTRVGRRPVEKEYSYNLFERITTGWDVVRAKQAYDSKHMVRNIDRMEIMRNKIQVAMLDKALSCLEYYKQMVTDAMPKSNIIDLNEKDIEKMTWCDNIKDQCQYFMDSDPDLHFPQMEKLTRFSLLDLTKVNFVKAKLCLYVMSIPANEVLAIPTQRALLFALSSILQLSRSVLKQWMDTRNIPLYDIDPLAK